MKIINRKNEIHHKRDFLLAALQKSKRILRDEWMREYMERPPSRGSQCSFPT
jgi:hypothetical protein